MGHYLEQLYRFLPVWAQNLGISLYGVAWRTERLGGDFDKHVAGFRERDRWSEASMGAYVDEELRRVLLDAFEKVPYYAERWRRAGLKRGDLNQIRVEELSKLPITPKDDLRRDPDGFVTSDSKRRKDLRRYCSSGSTGTPVTAICSVDSHRRFIAAREVRSFGWAGTTIHGPRSMIGGRLILGSNEPRAPFYRYNWCERQVYFSAYHISPTNVANYVHGFNTYRPPLLTGYAYSHYLLAQRMIEQGLALDYQPDAAVLSSEKLTRKMKQAISKAFKTRAYEEYSAVENCTLATECERGRLHVSPDFGIIEILDDRGLAVPPGKPGRIVCTGLLNDIQPLIRYEIGDRAIWSDVPCDCGRSQLPVLDEIVGRLEDVVVGPDGREMVRFHGIFLNLPHVVEGQVVQEKVDLLRVRVVTTPGFDRKEEATIRQRFWERLGSVDVIVDRVPRLERTELGKFRAVISHLQTTERDEHPE